MTNISTMEIAELRPFFTTAMKQLEAMNPPRDAVVDQVAAPSQDDADLSVRNTSAAPVESAARP